VCNRETRYWSLNTTCYTAGLAVFRYVSLLITADLAGFLLPCYNKASRWMLLYSFLELPQHLSGDYTRPENIVRNKFNMKWVARHFPASLASRIKILPISGNSCGDIQVQYLMSSYSRN